MKITALRHWLGLTISGLLKPGRSFLVLIIVSSFILRLPSLLPIYSYGDECITVALGQVIKKGLVLYRDIHDNKPPFLYLMAAIAGNLFWLRVILLVWGLLTTYLFYRLARLLRPGNDRFILVSTAFFGILSAIPLTEGNIVNGEVFMVLFTIAGISRLFCGKFDKKQGFILGLLFSFAALFKMPSAIDLGAVFFFLVFFETKNLKDLKINITHSLFVLAGFILPILVTFILYFFQGALKDYVIAAFLQNFGYLSSWKGSSMGLYLRGTALLASIIIVWFLKKRFSKPQIFIFLWFAFSLFGVLLPDRPYPHYLIQVLPATCLLFAGLIVKSITADKFLSFGCISLLIVTFLKMFWYYPTVPYYQNFFEYLTGGKNFQEYLSFLGGERVYKISDFIVSHTYKDEKIFIWGDSPCIYARSNRLPVGKYTAAYHISDFNGYKSTSEKIIEQKPRFIIDLKTESKPFKELGPILSSRYSPYQNDLGVNVYLLNPSE